MNHTINNLLAALNGIGEIFCKHAVGVFVQSALLIVALFAIDIFLRRRVRAVFRYCLWLLVLVKLVLPSTLSLPTGVGYWAGDHLPSGFEISSRSFDTSGHEHLGTAVARPHSGPSDNPVEADPLVAKSYTPVIALTWQAILFIIWLVGVSVFLALLVQRARFVKGLIVASTPATAEFAGVLEQCRRLIGVRSKTTLRISETIPSPAVCGFFRPTILIPVALVDKLSPEGLRAILIHELAHIKRGDLWVNSVQTFLQVVYFYNPFVWFANSVIRKVCEEAVDETVLVTLGGQAENYSNTLIDIGEMAFWRADLGLRLIGVAESKKALQWRIRHMLTRPIPRSSKLGILGIAALLAAAAVLLPMARAEESGGESQFVADENDAKPTYPLHKAAGDGDIEEVKLLVSKGADVSAKDSRGATPLHFAAENGQKDVFEFLIAEGADINGTTDRGMGALHIAAYRGHKDVVETILDKGVDIETKGHDGKSALESAACGGHIELVKFLLAKGANVNSRANNGATPLCGAAWYGHTDVAEILLTRGAEVNPVDVDGWNPVRYAIGNGKEDVANLIIARGGKVNNEIYGTTLHCAVLNNCSKVVEQLIAGGEDVNVKDEQGNTPLHAAMASARDLEMLKMLIVKGADTNARNTKGQTPLNRNIWNTALEKVKLLIAHGADVNTKDESGSTPLHMAAQRGRTEVVQILLANGADANAQASDGMTPVYEALRETFWRLPDGHVEVVDLLLADGVEASTIHLAAYSSDLDNLKKFIEQGIDVNAKHVSLLAPLHAAAKGGNREAVGLLIAEGADVNAKGYKDRTPLHYAADAGRKEVVEQLITLGADINPKCASGRMPIHYAAYAGHLDVVQQLIDQNADMNTKDSRGWEPLPYAMAGFHEDIAQFLIDRGANIDVEGPGGGGLLHLAVSLRQKDMIELLLTKGADVNAKDHRDMTPLHFLAQVGGNEEIAELSLAKSTEVAKLLLAKGADVNVRDGRGRTPLLLAKNRGEQKELIGLLLKHGAREW